MSYALRREIVVPDDAESMPFVSASAIRPEPTTYLRWKATLGRIVALAMLAAGLPVMLLTILAVRITSRGPAIFRQTRVGLNGRIFVMYKIRTMRVDAEAATGPVWTQQNDPRITPLGRLIRKLHLDEFPQLINVLRGEMALIGPRPERPEFTKKLALVIPGYLDRHVVRPGITGLAQINLPPDTDYDSVRRKQLLDLAYIREGSLWLDVRIIACTCARMFAIKGPRVTQLFGLERLARLPAESRAELKAVSSGDEFATTVPSDDPLEWQKNSRPPRSRSSSGNGHAQVRMQKPSRTRHRPK